MATTTINVLVPDLGGADDVEVIEILVAVGDKIAVEDPIVTLESDKASMEVPSSAAGVVESIAIAMGDKLAEGGLILTLSAEDAQEASPTQQQSAKVDEAVTAPSSASVPAEKASAPVASKRPGGAVGLYAGPAVRRIAREFGVDLAKIQGTGIKGRLVKEDLQKYVKQQLQLAQSGGGMGFDLPEMAKVDFAKFGSVTEKPLSKINKLSGSFLHRNWLSIPHVTQFEEVDITDMEAFRQKHKGDAAEKGVKLTPIVFVMKALLSALKEFPAFNASLSSDGQSLMLKQYYNIGVAVDTPNGLMVPVIRDVECKGAFELAAELGAISKKAREKGLTPVEMQGGCMTISSLGGIGGTAFTPIINAPEVAILGLSRSYMKPVFDKESNAFQPRLTLPVSLSYDHRVIDGAEAARFIVFFASRIADLETLIL